MELLAYFLMILDMFSKEYTLRSSMELLVQPASQTSLGRRERGSPLTRARPASQTNQTKGPLCSAWYMSL